MKPKSVPPPREIEELPDAWERRERGGKRGGSKPA